MSSLAGRRGLPAIEWLLPLLGLCVVVGVASGVSPKYGLVAVLGLGFVIVTFSNLVLGIAIFVALSFLDILSIGATVSFDKVAGLLLLMSWLLRHATGRRDEARAIASRHPWLVVWSVAMVAWELISILWATSHGTVLTVVFSHFMLLLLPPILFTAVRSRRDLRTIIVGYLIGAAFSAVWGLIHPSSAGSAAAGRLVGSLGEANQSATVLVAGLALCAGLAITARYSPRIRMLIVIVPVLALIGLVDTLSRAGLIALAVVLALAVVVGGRWRKPAVRLLVVGMIGLPVYFAFFAPSFALNRVTSGGSSGRNEIWMVAWRVFTANPILGVGADNFEMVSVKYLQRPGAILAAQNFIVSPKVVHNIYLEQLADVGIFGLVTLIGVLTVGIAAVLKAAHIFERLGDIELELTARCTLLALSAFLAADFFASELGSKQLWLIFALCPALLKVAETELRSLRPPAQ